MTYDPNSLEASWFRLGEPGQRATVGDEVVAADVERMRRYAESSPSVVTPLNRLIGYEAAAQVAKVALAHGATIRETVWAMGFVERGELTLDQLDEALDVASMTRPSSPAASAVES